MIDLKDVQAEMDRAKKLMETTLEGLPERMKALKNVSAQEGEMLRQGAEKIAEVTNNIDIELKDFAKFKDYKE